MNKVQVADWEGLPNRTPAHALVADVDLVVVRLEDRVSVLYGRCHHRGALLADGHIQGNDLICGVHQWDYRVETGVSSYNNQERLHKFGSWIEDGAVWVDEEEVATWQRDNPQPFQRDAYQGTYADVHGTIEEPHVALIHELASNGLEKVGHHGAVAAMGVPRQQLPTWDDLQFLTAQLATLPHLLVGPKLGFLPSHPVSASLGNYRLVCKSLLRFLRCVHGCRGDHSLKLHDPLLKPLP